ncbi:hypothetical protein L1987_39241 [Smallanthus sonchifolius]|uniref:Uncharacterized protein n=1 Tax=Smallanthus sonchifolius TaxID=185202 RepID=A0ACB9HLG6_9ASTR|nr:hypothetical protein L1987_39241 [Smallanthus sonchifolius]
MKDISLCFFFYFFSMDLFGVRFACISLGPKGNPAHEQLSMSFGDAWIWAIICLGSSSHFQGLHPFS